MAFDALCALRFNESHVDILHVENANTLGKSYQDPEYILVEFEGLAKHRGFLPEEYKVSLIGSEKTKPASLYIAVMLLLCFPMVPIHR
jgi:hypothetical protein